MIKNILLLVWIIGIALIIVFCTHTAFNEILKQETSFKSGLGKNVVLNKDTLLIVDYSILKETYTLSNGKTVSIELCKKLILK